MPEEYEEEYLKFFPYQVMLEVTALVVIAGILLVASSFPAELRPEYNPLSPPRHLIPEWYLMPLYQILKTEGLGSPIFGTILLGAVIIFLLAVPFIDRSAERHPLRRPWITSIGLFFAALTVVLLYIGFAVEPQELKAWQFGIIVLGLLGTAWAFIRISMKIRYKSKAIVR